MTSAQILILLEYLTNKDISITEFSWSHTDNLLHLHFFDAGGNKFHKVFNVLGHVMDWED